MQDSNITLTSQYFSSVRCHNELLHPYQQPSSKSIRMKADYHEQRMYKYADIGRFHSLAELYFAGLLEGDQAVDYYVPQPYRLRILGKPYIPDMYYIKHGKRYVVELKPGAKFDEAMLIPLKTFFKYHNIEFFVKSNESVFEKVIAAQNWLSIVKNLVLYRDIYNEDIALNVYSAILNSDSIEFGEIINIGDRSQTEAEEVAVYHLLHSGKIETNLDTRFIDYKTELRVCT